MSNIGFPILIAVLVYLILSLLLEIYLLFIKNSNCKTVGAFNYIFNTIGIILINNLNIHISNNMYYVAIVVFGLGMIISIITFIKGFTTME